MPLDEPSRLTGTPNRLDSPQIRKSHMLATPRPPPTHSPSINAMTGWRQARIAAKAGWTMPAYARACAALDRVVANSEISAPTLKARPPAPRMTTQRRSPSSQASIISRRPRYGHRHGVELFRTVQHHGRDRAHPSCRSTRTCVTPWGGSAIARARSRSEVGDRRRPPRLDVQVHAELVEAGR